MLPGLVLNDQVIQQQHSKQLKQQLRLENSLERITCPGGGGGEKSEE